MSRFIPFFTPILHEITAILLQDYCKLKINFLIILYDYLNLSNSSGIIVTAVKPFLINETGSAAPGIVSLDLLEPHEDPQSVFNFRQGFPGHDAPFIDQSFC